MTMADPRPEASKTAAQHKHMTIYSALEDVDRAVQLVEALLIDITHQDNPPPSDISTKVTSAQAPSLKEILDTTPNRLHSFYTRLSEAVENIRREIFYG